MRSTRLGAARLVAITAAMTVALVACASTPSTDAGDESSIQLTTVQGDRFDLADVAAGPAVLWFWDPG